MTLGMPLVFRLSLDGLQAVCILVTLLSLNVTQPCITTCHTAPAD